jgi:hypothetical protein
MKYLVCSQERAYATVGKRNASVGALAWSLVSGCIVDASRRAVVGYWKVERLTPRCVQTPNGCDYDGRNSLECELLGGVERARSVRQGVTKLWHDSLGVPGIGPEKFATSPIVTQAGVSRWPAGEAKRKIGIRDKFRNAV